MDLIVLISTSVLISILGVLVFLRNQRSIVNITFLFFIISVLIWTISNYLVDLSNTQDLAIFWTKLTFIGSYYIPAFLLLFTFVFPKQTFVKESLKKKIYLILIFPVFLTLLTFSKLVISGVGDINIKPISPVFGVGYYLFVVYFLFFISYSFINLIQSYRKSSISGKNQIRYLFFGLLLAVIFGISTNLVLPLFNYSQLSNYGSYATYFFIIFTAYAITKHKLLEIKLIILRTITYSLVVIIISAFFVTIGIYLPNLIDSVSLQVAIAILASVFIVIILEPLKKYIGKATDKLFFKATINYAELLRQLSETINREIDLQKLVEAVENRLSNQLKIQYAKIALPAPSNLEFVTLTQTLGKELRIPKNTNLVKYVENSKRIVMFEALERRIEDTQEKIERKELEKSKEQLDQMGASIVSPIFTTDKKLSGLLILGIKKSGDPYSQEELNLLELLGPQLASAIEKSRLYDEIQRFNIKLQKEIAIATEDLRQTNEEMQDRNRFLSSLQTVTNLITRSLDFKKVTQSIVDSIATQMGYIGGILLFYGESRHKLFPEAITRVQFKDQVEKLLQGKLSSFHADVRKDQTLAVKTVINGVITKGTKLSDFVSPPVPQPACWAIQRLVSAHGFIGIPITSENEIVGCIIFITHENPDELNKNDISMMTALADQTGIVYRNLQLVQKLRATNDELAEANEHLKQLDQAKSEFVSIASHQLRTPMTGIMGYLSMFVGGDFGRLPTQQKKVLQQLLDASQRMIQLINLFLDVTKIESGRLVLDRRPMHIEEIIQRSYDVLSKLAANKSLKLVWNKPKKPLPTLTIDEKIFDVVSNLIDNAIKYTEKGTVTVTAEVDDGNVKVTVKDTGRGIEPQEAKNLFNKFVRGYGIAQVNPDGSGLGLYVARRLTEAHGGKIWVESKGTGYGSSFIFTLPIIPAPIADDAT